MTEQDEARTAFRARILREDDDADGALLDGLRADPRIEVADHRDELLAALDTLRAAPVDSLRAEPTRWAYFPWRRCVVGILGPRGYRALRLDRNRNLITAEEQTVLNGLTVGVAGLSVGHAIAHTLAAQGLAGTIRLTDFDEMELSNLNRVPATVLDLGVNKAVVAARRIAELDPYLGVEVSTAGVTPDNLAAFLDGLDIVVDECDSFAMKVLIREAARDRGLPVLMATSDRGLVDVERFDREPRRPVFHGVLGAVRSADLFGRPNRDNLPHMLRHLDPSRSSSRFTASLVEMDATLSTWPQLAGDVILGAAAVAEGVRRIGLGEPLPSGQTRIDIAELLGRPDHTDATAPAIPLQPDADTDDDSAGPTAALPAIAAAANRAPSGGNAQPWSLRLTPDAVSLSMDLQRTSLMDVAHRGSAVALGAAAFNARVAAAAHGVLGPLSWTESADPPGLSVTLRLADGDDPRLAGHYDAVLQRETNRRAGTPTDLDAETAAALTDAAAGEGGRLNLLTARADIDRAAGLFAAADRIRYLTPSLHGEMIAELRWPGMQSADSGIDVRSLELSATNLAALDVLRRPDVMAEIARWDAGVKLGDDARERLATASALGVVTVVGSTLRDFARGGCATEAVWVAAEERGLAVQPISPVFLHANDRAELAGLSEVFTDDLVRLRDDFRELAGTRTDEVQVLVFRFAHAGRASVRSRRHPVR
jgi:molybdopterin/thiamine biosynthesis adenylyltransferase/nitroreductase